jgi:death-on-curing protein
MKETCYINIRFALMLHQSVVATSGGLQGVKNEGLIESALELIKNDDYYSTFEEKLTHLVFSIIKNHAFNDGNKRTSIALGASFLLFNKYDYCVDNFIQIMRVIVIAVAENSIDKDGLQRIIIAIINYGKSST